MANPFTKWLKSKFNLLSWGRDVPISMSGGTGGNRFLWLPGTEIDWDAELGDMWNVPGVAACYHWCCRNFLQAPPKVERFIDGAWQEVPFHPLATLLNNPNVEYDGAVLFMGLLLSWYFAGDAYFLIYRNQTFERELIYIPHFMVTPKRNTDKSIYYEYRNGANTFKLTPEEIVRIRQGVDPRMPLRGMSPLASAARDGYVMQQDATYRAKSMKNLGLVTGLITPKVTGADGLQALAGFEPSEVMDKIREKTTGDKAGEPIVWNVPLGFERVGMTPQDLLMETISDRSESTVAACFGVAPQAVGLHVGRLSKTYANMSEARESSWEEGLIPTINSFAQQIGNQMLPLFSSSWQQERLVFDISNIRPLQPDMDAIWERARKAFEVGGIDRYIYLLEIGKIPEESDKGVYATGQASPTQGADTNGN